MNVVTQYQAKWSWKHIVTTQITSSPSCLTQSQQLKWEKYLQITAGQQDEYGSFELCQCTCRTCWDLFKHIRSNNLRRQINMQINMGKNENSSCCFIQITVLQWAYVLVIQINVTVHIYCMQALNLCDPLLFWQCLLGHKHIMQPEFMFTLVVVSQVWLMCRTKLAVTSTTILADFDFNTWNHVFSVSW